MTVFNNVARKQNYNLPTIDRKCNTVGKIRIAWRYSTGQWHLPQGHCCLPFSPTHFSCYQHYICGNTTSHHLAV